MAQYAVLIYDQDFPNGVEDIPPEVMAAHGRVEDGIKELGGSILAAMALQPVGTATSIRRDVVTDGPFVESKEVLGGVFVVEARDLDHALAMAKLVPSVSGGVEVRPLLG